MDRGRRDLRVIASEARERRDVDALLNLLSGTDPVGRQTAVYNLGKTKSPKAVLPLIRCLQARDELLRVGALKALANIGDPRAVPAVYDVATGNDAFGVRVDAASALGALGDRRAVTLIAAMLDDEACRFPGWYRKWAAKRLLQLGGTEAIEDLEQARQTLGPLRLLSRWRLGRAIVRLRKLKRDASA